MSTIGASVQVGIAAFARVSVPDRLSGRQPDLKAASPAMHGASLEQFVGSRHLDRDPLGVQ